MDQSSTATLIAAILASALSLLGILVSAFLSHRQRKAEDEREVRQLDFLREQATTTWLRQELYRNSYTFIDAAFGLSGLSGNLRDLQRRGAGDSDEARALHTRLIDQHEALKSAQTAIRLLASNQLVLVTENCHEAHDVLFESVLGLNNRKSLTDDAWDSAKTRGRQMRETFITEARDPVGLEVYAHKIRQYGVESTSSEKSP